MTKLSKSEKAIKSLKCKVKSFDLDEEFKGHFHYRIQQNEEHGYNDTEKIFYKLFKKYDKEDLWQRLMNVEDGVRITKREKKIIATIFQWLGTNVGRAFLSEAGFYRNRR